MSYKDSEVYQEHMRIGFPVIDESDQFEILVNYKYELIIDLAPKVKHLPFPHGILKEYITLTKSQLKQHLIDIGYIQQQLDSFSKTYDGFWLKKTEKGYVYFERERGTDYDIQELDSEEQVLDIYVHRLGWCCSDA